MQTYDPAKGGRPLLYPPGTPVRNMLIKLPESTAAALDDYAYEHKTSKSLLIETLVRGMVGKSTIGDGYHQLVIRAEQAEARNRELRGHLDLALETLAEMAAGDEVKEKAWKRLMDRVQ